MSLSAALIGFVTIILSISVAVTPGQTDWAVNYGSTEICAMKGSSVDIWSSFRYPPRQNGRNTTVEQMIWFVREENKEPVDLRTEQRYAGRVRYRCADRKCTVSITDLTESDSAEYKLRLITNQLEGSFTGTPGVKLTVTAPQVKATVTSRCVSSCRWLKMECKNSCVPRRSSYVWYQNGKNNKQTQKTYTKYFYPADSVSCALKDYERFSSPTVCVFGDSCTAVTYAERSVCAFRGSSVTIPCSHSSKIAAEAKFWFRRWETKPLDLQRDFRGRAHVDMMTGHSTLTIRNLAKSDSGEYCFRFREKNGDWTNSFPGTTLTVADPDIKVQLIWSPHGPKLTCHSSCLRPGPASFVWYKNGEKLYGETSFLYGGTVDGADRLSCAYDGYRSDSVYGPTAPKVLMSNSGDVMKDSSVSLDCSSDANPPANYSWYKKNQKVFEGRELVFRSIQPPDSGEYLCEAENDLARVKSTSAFIDVKYAPKPPSVSVSPSGEIVEGSSVNLTCSSDANPAANYTWFRENQTLSEEQEGLLQFTSISYKDRGNYYCRSTNQHGQNNSTLQYLDVQYAPKPPSVSVSPSGEIVEGSSVTLTCSSDANPAASYSWFREGEETPRASGQTFIMDDFRPEHSGTYYCAAENIRGARKSTPQLVATPGSFRSAAAGATAAVLLTLVVLAVCLYMRRSEKFPKQSRDGEMRTSEQVNTGPVQNAPPAAAEAEEGCDYSTIRSPQVQTDSLYSNITRFTPQAENVQEDRDLDYSVIIFDSIARKRHEENVNESSTVYSTVKKINR